MKDQKSSDSVSDIFKPQNYSYQNAMMKLNNLGGIFGLFNLLKTGHRTGLSSNDPNDIQCRVKNYGRNKAPFGENIFKKSLLQERDFIVNFLFYLLTLRICVKMLLFRDEFRGIKPLGEQTFHLRITAELISYFLLICMVLLKAKVSVQYYRMDQDQRKYKNQKIYVKRDGERKEINQQDLMVGDIIIIQGGNSVVRIDGIVVKSRNLVVSQAHTILRQDIKSKKDIWTAIQAGNRGVDPFILAGSYIIGGSGQILVCTVGCKCSFRIDKQTKGYYSEYTPSIAQLKKTMNSIQNIARVITLILATFTSTYYLIKKYYNVDMQISWIDLLYILKVYCGYIGLVCFIQRLKVIKTLQFYIQANRSQKQYRIKNRATIQQMSKLDILFIQSSTLAMRKVQVRDSIKIQLDHILEVSEINKFCRIKIISSQDRQQILETFGKDINHECIFQPNQQVAYSTHVKSLVQATFLSQTSIPAFLNNYLPIYRALKYQVGYLYDSSNEQNRDIPPQILQINFQRLVVNPLFNQPSYPYSSTNINSYPYGKSDQNSTSLSYNPSYLNNFWLKIQNKLFMQDILYKIFIKSHIYSQLYNIYMVFYVNNLLVLIALCYFSTMVNVINLSWYLLVIIVQRYMFFTVYKRITEYKNVPNIGNSKNMELWSYVKINAVLFFYYLYVVNRMKFISSLFLFFFVNAILRIEAVLYQKRPFNRNSFFKRIGKIFGIYLIVHLIVILVQLEMTDFYTEEINNVKYVGGLFGIYMIYALFL